MKTFWKLVFLFGVALVMYGAYTIHPGLAWILAGLEICVISSILFGSEQNRTSSSSTKDYSREVH